MSSANPVKSNRALQITDKPLNAPAYHVLNEFGVMFREELQNNDWATIEEEIKKWTKPLTNYYEKHVLLTKCVQHEQINTLRLLISLEKTADNRFLNFQERNQLEQVFAVAFHMNSEQITRIICEHPLAQNMFQSHYYPANLSLHTMIKSHKNNTAKAMVIAGAQINRLTIEGISPLATACSEFSVDMVHFLLEKGADPNLQGYYHQGPRTFAPLHFAIDADYQDLGKSIEIIKALLAYKANPNIGDANNKTPLFTLLETAKPHDYTLTVLELFVAHGANLEHIDREERTLFSLVEKLKENYVNAPPSQRQHAENLQAFLASQIDKKLLNELVDTKPSKTHNLRKI